MDNKNGKLGNNGKNEKGTGFFECDIVNEPKKYTDILTPDDIQWAKKLMIMSSKQGGSIKNRVVDYKKLRPVLNVIKSEFVEKLIPKEKRKTGTNKDMEALKSIVEKNSGVCWDYARTAREILSNSSPCDCWIAGYPCSMRGAPHAFLIIAGKVLQIKENDKENDKWRAIDYGRKELLQSNELSTRAPDKYKCHNALLVYDPFYADKVYLPGDPELENIRGKHAQKKWYIMYPDTNLTGKQPWCEWENFANKERAVITTHGTKAYFCTIKNDYKNHFDKYPWKFYA